MSREDIIYNAKLAEQAELYEDMVKYMKDVVNVCNVLQNDSLETTYQTRSGIF